MFATSSLQNHIVRELRAASRKVSPRFSRVGSLMRCPVAAHLALSGTIFIIIAPLEANLYLVKAFALGILPSWTRSIARLRVLSISLPPVQRGPQTDVATLM